MLPKSQRSYTTCLAWLVNKLLFTSFISGDMSDLQLVSRALFTCACQQDTAVQTRSIAALHQHVSCCYRWGTALLQLLQLSLPDTEREVVAATVHAMSAMAHFVEHIQQDCHAYHKLALAAAAAVQAGNRSDGMQQQIHL